MISSRFRRMVVRFTPSPAMAVALVALAVAMSGTAYAASKINGRNIERGTITSKQIKNKTIQKSDLSSKVGTIGAQGPAGPAGPAGPQGVPGANSVVVRTKTEDVAQSASGNTTATCNGGEVALSGGGYWHPLDFTTAWDWALGSTNVINRFVFTTPGAPPTGWMVEDENPISGNARLTVWVTCAHT